MTHTRQVQTRAASAAAPHINSALPGNVSSPPEVAHTALDHGIHLLLAGSSQLSAVLLKALLGSGVAWGHLRAVLLLVGQALLEEAHAEAYVVAVLHVLSEELLLAVPAQLHVLVTLRATQGGAGDVSMRSEPLAHTTGVQ